MAIKNCPGSNVGGWHSPQRVAGFKAGNREKGLRDAAPSEFGRIVFRVLNEVVIHLQGISNGRVPERFG